MDQIKIGKFIAERRKLAGLTQMQLSERLGVTDRAVSKWENRIGYPDVTLIPHLAEILKIPIEILFGKTQNVTAITDGSCTLSGECGALFSVFAIGQARVSIAGAKYPLTDARLEEGYPLGVSNALRSPSVTVSAKGSVLIFFEKTLKLT